MRDCLPWGCPRAAAATRGSRGCHVAGLGANTSEGEAAGSPCPPHAHLTPFQRRREPLLAVLTLSQPALQDPNCAVRAAPTAPDECHPAKARIRPRAASRGDISSFLTEPCCSRPRAECSTCSSSSNSCNKPVRLILLIFPWTFRKLRFREVKETDQDHTASWRQSF